MALSKWIPVGGLVAARCCIVINREVLFFHSSLITQGGCPDTFRAAWDRLIDQDILREGRPETWTVMHPAGDWCDLGLFGCLVIQIAVILYQTCYY